MFKKIVTSIVLASFILLNISVPVAKAQYWHLQEFDDWYQRVYDDQNPDEIFGERYTAAQVEWVIYGLWAFLINHMGARGSLIVCVMRDSGNAVDLIANCTDDLIATISQFWTSNLLGYQNTHTDSEALAIYDDDYQTPLHHILSGNRPISGIGYVRNAVAKSGIIKEAKAQGFGFEAASTMRGLWVAVRNLTYFLLILLVIAMSFMIMFRFKISPQTVITVQSALPRVVGALLLITFSYAIAGFVIDLLYVVIGVIAAVLTQSGLFIWGPVQLPWGPSPNTPVSWSDMYNNLAGIGFGRGVLGVMFFYFVTFLVISILVIQQAFGLLFTALGLSTIIWFVTVIVVFIALLIIFLKTMWMLIKTFVTVLLLVATGPIFILVGGFTGWLRNLASNLAVFAAIGPMLAISFLFMGSAIPDNLGAFGEWLASAIPFNPAYNVMGSSTWSPPFLPRGDNLDLVWLFASFVIITLIPNAANIIKSLISGRPFGYGTAVGAALGAAAGTAWAPFGMQAAALQKSWAETRAGNIIKGIQAGKYGESVKRFGGF